MSLPHPQLPAGANADDINGDEFNGAGTIWPYNAVSIDAFEPLTVMIVDMIKLAFFNECPDYVASCVEDTITIPAVCDTIVIPGRKRRAA